MILKHVKTCSESILLNMILKHVLTCLDSIWYKLLGFIWFSNMSEHVQTCPNLFIFNMIHMNCYNAYNSQTCLNMSKLVQIQYDRNWHDSWNLSEWQMNIPWKSYSLDRCEQVEWSKISYFVYPILILQNQSYAKW